MEISKSNSLSHSLKGNMKVVNKKEDNSGDVFVPSGKTKDSGKSMADELKKMKTNSEARKYYSCGGYNSCGGYIPPSNNNHNSCGGYIPPSNNNHNSCGSYIPPSHNNHNSCGSYIPPSHNNHHSCGGYNSCGSYHKPPVNSCGSYHKPPVNSCGGYGYQGWPSPTSC